MRKQSSGTRRRLGLVPVACLALMPHPSQAQQTTPPAPPLDGILHQLQINLDQYRALVPSFYCKEHVVSDVSYGGGRQYRATDSTFRLARDPSRKLVESREIEAINGAPVRSQHLGGPVVLGGVFTGGLVAVSESEKSCMQYTLQPEDPGHPDRSLVIRFSTLPEPSNRPECVLKEEGSGRVLIDPATLQVTRMDVQAPDHHLNTGERGLWKISIDYAPVDFGAKTFWLPKFINSTFVTDESKSPTTYTYFAHDYDYHKLEVTSRIVPGTER